MEVVVLSRKRLHGWNCDGWSQRLERFCSNHEAPEINIVCGLDALLAMDRKETSTIVVQSTGWRTGGQHPVHCSSLDKHPNKRPVFFSSFHFDLLRSPLRNLKSLISIVIFQPTYAIDIYELKRLIFTFFIPGKITTVAIVKSWHYMNCRSRKSSVLFY